MEKNFHYFLVGIFVSASLLALTLFVIWLAGTHDSRNFDTYTVYFHDPVSGLKPSAIVQYRGVEVGRVNNVRLSPEKNDLIKVNIEVADTTPISKSSLASLATQGITGLVYIELTTDEVGDQTPPVIPQGEVYPVIEGKGTQLSKLFQDIPAITTQILALTEKLNKVFDEDASVSLAQTLKNVEDVSKGMSVLLNDENIQNTGNALRNLSETSENMNDLVARFNQTADQIDQAVGSLNSVLTDNKANIDKFAGSGLNQITEMSRETREMARAIRRLADTIEQEPSRLLYQPNYRGVEIQK